MSSSTRAGGGVSISVVGLRKEYVSGTSSIAALNGVDLEIAAGEAVAIMGPSGSGKSTLLHLIAAMDTPSGGSLRVGGRNIEALGGAQAARYRRSVGFVFQTFNLLGSLTALDNVLAPLLPSGEARRHEADAFALLDRVGLGARADALPGELSGGERQRVAIARALISRPTLLLADEPTGNLDSATGQAMVELLLSLRAQHKMTLVVATHDASVSGALQRVVMLRDGRAA
jgi:putative ABC transport system ATP-binding protein